MPTALYHGPKTRGSHASHLWATAALVLWLVALTIVEVRQLRRPDKNSVFPIYIEAGQHWLESADLYEENGRYVYSPPVAAFFAFLARLPLRLSMALWLALNVAGFVAGTLLWARDFFAASPRASSRTAAQRADLLGCFALLLLPLAIGNFNNLQANPLVIGTLLLAVCSLRRRRWSLAAIFITIATVFKVYPLSLGCVFVVLYPRKLAWRLALALALVFLGTFAMQKPSYVTDMYRSYAQALRADARFNIAYDAAPRDLALLLRIWVFDNLNEHAYRLVQACGALLVGAIALAARSWKRPWRGTNRNAFLTAAVICWIMLLGPSSESATYILLAPLAAAFLLRSHLDPFRSPVRILFHIGYLVLVMASIAIWFPAGRVFQTLGPQPLAALFLTAALILWRTLHAPAPSNRICPPPPPQPSSQAPN